MWSSSIWPIDRILSGFTTPGQSGNEGVLRLHQSITGAPIYQIVNIIIRTLVGAGFYLSAENVISSKYKQLRFS